ncbi:hypothetical protein [Variovorax sp. HJSM1_2]|uniref:hypothetical protein n=1 Tax=Variovorax sp. HJSM1_2 TaxID=3366263 RepID=UPI003BE84499
MYWPVRVISLGLLALVCVNGAIVEQVKVPKFRSEYDPLYARLERLQKEQGQCEKPVWTKEQHLERYRKLIAYECAQRERNWQCENTEKGIRTVAARLPTTSCESPAVQTGYGFFADTLAQALRQEVPGIELPAVGTLRTGDLNAVAWRHRQDGRYVILIDPALDHFQGELGRYLMSFYEIKIDHSPGQATLALSYSSQDIGRRLREPDRLSYFRDLIHNAAVGQKLPMPLALETQRKGFIQQFFRSDMHERVYDAMSAEGMNFIVAHEYAHALLRHTQSAQLVERPLSGGTEQNITTDLHNQAQEFDADALATRLLRQGRSGLDEELIVLLDLTPEFLMIALELLELERARLGMASPQTHPSAAHRRAALAAIRKKYGLSFNKGQDVSPVDDLHQIALVSWASANGLCEGRAKTQKRCRYAAP